MRKPEDIEDDETTFKADMSHQVYGDRWASHHVIIRDHVIVISYMNYQLHYPKYSDSNLA